MASLSAKLLCKVRAFGKSAVRVAVGVLGVAGLVVSAVRSVTALGGDLLQLILGEIGEVGGVGGSHLVIVLESGVCVV